jgi:nitrile hydratase
VLAPENVAAVLRKGGPTERTAATNPLFAVGDRVRARNTHPQGHTRLPRYARGHVGVIDRLHGCHVFPDSNAHGKGENPQWLYTVRFSGRELWGERAEATSSVSVDAWESYLERAE